MANNEKNSQVNYSYISRKFAFDVLHAFFKIHLQLLTNLKGIGSQFYLKFQILRTDILLALPSIYLWSYCCVFKEIQKIS
jgi:hypothetical protein